MNNYIEITDFEINLAVAKLYLPYEHINENPAIGNFVEWGDGTRWNQFDPCNSWADAGQIIEREKINIEYRYDCNGFWLAGFGPGKGSKAFLQKKPLRAAMIVFLMMQESK